MKRRRYDPARRQHRQCPVPDPGYSPVPPFQTEVEVRHHGIEVKVARNRRRRCCRAMLEAPTPPLAPTTRQPGQPGLLQGREQA